MPSAFVAGEATRSVPIVFTNVIDPVGGSLVASLARPAVPGMNTPTRAVCAPAVALAPRAAPLPQRRR
jgi:ABC-type uncharacterized transport system substrate-binding protein